MYGTVMEQSRLNENVKIIKKAEQDTRSTPERRKKRVAAYCRVSTDLEVQEASLELQMEAFRKVIAEHTDWELAGIFADEGLTGTQTENRLEFQRMMESARNGLIDVILVKSVSRFARNTADFLRYTRELTEMGVAIYFEKEYIETALYLIFTPNTGLFFAHCSIYCGFVGASEPEHCGLSLICRLNMQDGMERYWKINAKQSPVWIEFLTRLCYTDICIIVSISNRQE